MTTKIKGQPPSTEIRERLAAEGRPVLVAFSGGKDAIATTIALKEAGVSVILAHLYLIPPDENGRGLGFIDRSLAKLEDQLGERIYRYPHPAIYRWLNSLAFQPPERCSIIEAAQLPDLDFDAEWVLIREALGLDPDTWVADGVRAADSIVRRASLSRHGIMKPAHHKVSPIADWLKAEVLDSMKRAHVDLPEEYAWFKRSFDGLDYRFLAPMKEHAPEDFQRVLEWFPLADLELIRHDL